MRAPDMTPEGIVRAEFVKLLRTDHPDGIEKVPLAELGIDSLDFFEKILYLDDEFGITIPIQELDNEITLEDLLTIVKR